MTRGLGDWDGGLGKEEMGLPNDDAGVGGVTTTGLEASPGKY